MRELFVPSNLLHDSPYFTARETHLLSGGDTITTTTNATGYMTGQMRIQRAGTCMRGTPFNTNAVATMIADISPDIIAAKTKRCLRFISR